MIRTYSELRKFERRGKKAFEELNRVQIRGCGFNKDVPGYCIVCIQYIHYANKFESLNLVDFCNKVESREIHAGTYEQLKPFFNKTYIKKLIEQ